MRGNPSSRWAGMFPKRVVGRSSGNPLTSVHQRGQHCFSSPQQRETESQSWAVLGERSELGLHRGCLRGARSSSGFCRTGRQGSAQATERSVCQRRYSRELCPLSPSSRGPPGGTPLPPPAPAAAGPRNPGIWRGGKFALPAEFRQRPRAARAVGVSCGRR